MNSMIYAPLYPLPPPHTVYYGFDMVKRGGEGSPEKKTVAKTQNVYEPKNYGIQLYNIRYDMDIR